MKLRRRKPDPDWPEPTPPPKPFLPGRFQARKDFLLDGREFRAGEYIAGPLAEAVFREHPEYVQPATIP